MPEVRPQKFLATKDGVARPRDMIKRIDLRLEVLGTDYIDVLYFHALLCATVLFIEFSEIFKPILDKVFRWNLLPPTA